jgi:mitochondrial splicing suppressor protein 51
MTRTNAARLGAGILASNGRQSCRRAWCSPLGAASGSSANPASVTAGASRNLFGFSFGNKDKQESAGSTAPRKQPIIGQDDLFHPLSKSPIDAMRARGERVRALAPCPVSMVRDGVRRPVRFECPDCGWPTHYSEKEWAEDTEHGKYVGRLREANEDEHDLRSGREMQEFKLPGPQGFEEVINMSNWDVFFYTRNFNSIESDRSRRHVSKLLTFPCTVAGVIHENSPYTKRSHRLTHEGLRSMIGEYFPSGARP